MGQEWEISNVKKDEDGLYFVFNSARGRFVECMVEYDEEMDELIVRGNDHIVGKI